MRNLEERNLEERLRREKVNGKSTKEYKGRTDSNNLTGPNKAVRVATLLL